MRTRYRRDREDIWMVQSRDKGSTHLWMPIRHMWFLSKKDAEEYIRLYTVVFVTIREYRVKRYRPCEGAE